MKTSCYSNSQYIDLSSTHKKGRNEFRDSSDPIQRKNYLDSVYIRSYYEALYTWKNGGFILFDTLTYDDDHCPWVHDMFDFEISPKHDFRCFNKSHYKKFMDRLRKKLEYAGYTVKNNLKYQYVTEYGSDELYRDSRGRTRRGTKRPHYHALFYSTVPNLTPADLSRYIKASWQQGRTDGIDDHPETFNHNVFSATTDPNRVRGVTYYIAKYMLKDNEYLSIVKKHIPYLYNQLLQDQQLILSIKKEYKKKYSHVSWYVDPDAEKTIHWCKYVKKNITKYIKDKICQFHQTSMHFGEYAMQVVKAEDLVNNPYMKIPDKDKIYKFISLPRYYVYKYFYNLDKRSNGKYYWKPNSLGIDYLTNKKDEKIKYFINNYNILINSLGQSSPLLERINNLLDGRTIEDFVFYKVNFQNCFYVPGQELEEIDYTKNVLSMSEEYDLDSLSLLDRREIFRDCLIDQNSFYEFRDFDYLDSLFNNYFISVEERKKEEDMISIELIEKRMKEIGLKTKFNK